jgi:uncharacterized membrane protein
VTWAGFIGIFALFFATHSIPVRPGIKSRIVSRVGPHGFAVSYSILSLAMLALLIWAAGAAPFVELWPQMGWHRHATHAGMFAVCLVLAFSIGRPNPFSFGGARNDMFDPARPGIVRLVRHPVLAALAIWAVVHMLPNGDLAHVLFFGILGGFALGGRALINRRKKREMGSNKWDQLNATVADAPALGKPTSWFGAAARLLLGVVLFAILVALHPIVIGVSAL